MQLCLLLLDRKCASVGSIFTWFSRLMYKTLFEAIRHRLIRSASFNGIPLQPRWHWKRCSFDQPYEMMPCNFSVSFSATLAMLFGAQHKVTTFFLLRESIHSGKHWYLSGCQEHCAISNTLTYLWCDLVNWYAEMTGYISKRYSICCIHSLLVMH